MRNSDDATRQRPLTYGIPAQYKDKVVVVGPIYYGVGTVVTRRYQVPHSTWALFQPFTTGLWGAVIGLILMTATLMHIIGKIENYYQSNDINSAEQSEATLSDAVSAFFYSQTQILLLVAVSQLLRYTRLLNSDCTSSNSIAAAAAADVLILLRLLPTVSLTMSSTLSDDSCLINSLVSGV